MERKLAAILAADVVGFTGLVAKDEEGTLALLEQLLEQTVKVQVEAHRGRVFKSLGDGILAEFTSTVEAVNCAIGIQKASAMERHRSGDDKALQMRIGVSVGDVVVHGADLLGDGVNVAARLQSIADPGGIAVSGEVMSQVRGKVDIPLEDCGHKRLKESDEPLHVYKTREAKSGETGLFDFDEETMAKLLITGRCLCGAVTFEIRQPSISTGYCHCRFCQKFTGSAMSVWTAFPAMSIKFLGEEPTYFPSSPIVERGFCSKCGSSLTYRLIKPQPAGYIIVFTTALDKPEDFAPAIHGGTESKLPWFETVDDLARTTCAESRVLQEAWASVGLSDPSMWEANVKAKDVF